MVIITRRCVDCGKEKTAQKSYFYKNKIWIEEYRCHSCATKYWWKNNPNKHKNSKVTYTCIDCGKEKTSVPSDFKKPREEYRCYTCAQKHRRKEKITMKCADCGKEKVMDTYKIKYYKVEGEYRCYDCSRKHIRVEKVTYKCVDCGKERTDYECNFSKPKDEYRCKDCAHKNEKTIEKIRNSVIKLHAENDNYRENFKNGMMKKIDNPKIKESMKKRSENASYIEKLTGEPFWYGHHLLTKNNRKYYCELWNRDLKNRIDAAYDYKSILSGKDKFKNNGKNLDRHHLYWQEKACCVWDEDAQGYYAWINNGSNKYPVWIKYYIKGDPNKFVLLTHKEHGKVRGSKKSGKDKIWWIKFLERVVERREKEGKKCYLSKEEYEIYKIEHPDIMKKYKNNF